MPIEMTRASSAAEAAAALSRENSAYILGGGTGLMPRIHEGDQRVRHLIRVRTPNMIGITQEVGGLRIGAQVTMSQILQNQAAKVLHEAAQSVGSPALRNMATIGGNLFAGGPYGDLTAALLALGAEVEIASGTNTDRRELSSFIAERANKRLVIAVHISPLKAGTLHFFKMTRTHPRGAAIVTLAMTLTQSAGRISRATVAFCGLAGRPMRAPAVERALTGATLSQATIDAATARVGEGITPYSDALASGWYRQEMAALQLRHMLTELR